MEEKNVKNKKALFAFKLVVIILILVIIISVICAVLPIYKKAKEIKQANENVADNWYISIETTIQSADVASLDANSGGNIVNIIKILKDGQVYEKNGMKNYDKVGNIDGEKVQELEDYIGELYSKYLKGDTAVYNLSHALFGSGHIEIRDKFGFDVNHEMASAILKNMVYGNMN